MKFDAHREWISKILKIEVWSLILSFYMKILVVVSQYIYIYITVYLKGNWNQWDIKDGSVKYY